MKKRIAVLYGGRSGEHEVSRRSAASVVGQLDPSRYEVVLIGIDLQGVWHLQEGVRLTSLPGQGEVLALTAAARPVAVLPGRGLYQGDTRIDVDVVFPVLHGTFGEDGTIQGLLELAGLAYVGAGVLASSLAMDKEKAKQVWAYTGLPVVDFLTLRHNTPDTRRAAEEAFGYPFFVKPAAGGSSVGIHKVHHRGELEAAVEDAFRYCPKILVEPAIEGREIECAVLGNRDPVAFDPGEIIPRDHEFYDYQAKYLDPEGAALRIPAEVDPPIRESVRNIAVRACQALDVVGMARVDFFLEKGSQKLYLNEINTLPGFTNISMYPKMCQAAGVGYPQLLDRLIELAVESHEAGRRIRYRYQE
jgi:D-alanine-D-alanine ligase